MGFTAVKFIFIIILYFISINAAAQESNQEIIVAVAANFTPTLKQITKSYEEKNKNIQIKIVSSSSGSLYRQIVQGAPYDIFLSADEFYVKKLVKNDNYFSYAEGILALCSAQNKINQSNQAQILELLKKTEHIAIADPTLAPYGIAAKEFIGSIYNEIQPKLIFTKDVAQIINYIHTGVVSFGFIPLSMTKLNPDCLTANIWLVPQKNYTPIIQDIALLKDNDAAKNFFNYMKSDKVKKIIKNAGYSVL